MTVPVRDALLRRLERDTVVASGALALVALARWPNQPARALGVLGGAALVAAAYWRIRSSVYAAFPLPDVSDTSTGSGTPQRVAGASKPGFVKSFTRNAILGVGAYVMIARFEFDPVAMLAGVTTPALAAAVELVRTMRTRSNGSHPKSS